MKMNTRRTLARRVEENDMNEEISPQVEHVDKVLEGTQVPIRILTNDFSVVPVKLSNRENR